MVLTRALLVAVALFATTSVSAERFSNPTLGLSIEKPEDWHVLSAAANSENLKKAEIGSAELQEAIQKYASVPLYAFVKYTEPFADVNPSVKVNIRPVGSFAGRSGTEILQAILPGLAATMKDYELVAAPTATTLNGHTAGHAAINYSLQAMDSPIQPLRKCGSFHGAIIW